MKFQNIKKILNVILCISLLVSPTFANGGGEGNVNLILDKSLPFSINIKNYQNNSNVIQNDIENELNDLNLNYDLINFSNENTNNIVFKDYDIKENLELKNNGTSYFESKATFSNTIYKEEELTYLDLEDIEPDKIEHTCSFVSTYNDEYHWQYCTICGESAELLATLKGNNTTKPTDNENNTKGNINIEAHGTGGWVNSFVLPNYWQACDEDYEQKTCMCGATKVFHYNKGRGGNPTGYCSPYNPNGGTHENQLNNFVYKNHSLCRYCERWAGGDGNHCRTSNNKHGGGSVFNEKCMCGQNSLEFIDLKINYDTGSEIQYFLTIKHNGTYRSPFTNVFTQDDWNSGDNMRYKSFSYESLGDYTYKYIITYTYSSCITASGYQSTKIGLYNANLEAQFYPIYNDIDVRPKGELEPPVINTAEFSGLSINTDESGNNWIGQRTFSISGTENGNGAKITIKDDSGRIYYQGGMAKSGNNISLSIIPAIEANVRKTLHIIVEDLSGNKATKDIYIDNTDCKSPEIISELNYKENWKNKIIFKAEAYEGGVGLTQIALNKNSDFKFADKIKNPDNSGNDIYYRFYVFEGDVYGDDVITPTLFVRDGLNHLDSKKILIGKLDSTKPKITNVSQDSSQIKIIANDLHPTKGEGSGIDSYAIVPKGKYPTLKSFEATLSEIKRSGTYDIYVKDVAGNVSEPYTQTIQLNDNTNNYNLVVNILPEEDNSLLFVSNITNALTNQTPYMNWIKSRDYNFILGFLNIIDNQGTITYFKEEDINQS